jgi:hypothetical protein
MSPHVGPRVQTQGIRTILGQRLRCEAGERDEIHEELE